MPNLLPGQTTIGAIRKLVAAETDQPTPSETTNVPLDIYDPFINQSQRTVTELLVDSFQDYYVNPDNGNPFTFLTVPNTWMYALPNDYWKLLGMDTLLTPGQIQTAISMQEFRNQQRNAFQMYQAPNGQLVPLYRVVGNQIWLQPMPPPVGIEILVRYVPVLPDMMDRGTISIDQPFVVGDSVTIGAQSTLPQAAPVNGVLPALAKQVQYVAIDNGGTPVNTPTRVEFKQGATANEAAQNLADAINGMGSPPPWSTGSASQDRSVASVTADGNVVTLLTFSALAIVWSSLDSKSQYPAPYCNLDPLPVASQFNPYGAWANFGLALNGFDELVVVDSAIKVNEKQGKDTATLRERWGNLWKRVQTQANNRNASQNGQTVKNYRRGWAWRGYGGGPWGR